MTSSVDTSRLVQELVGDGAILAAQALRENRAGVECCKLIAEENSIWNLTGYLLMILRQGDYHWIMEEQERSERRVRATSGIWWLCDCAQ